MVANQYLSVLCDVVRLLEEPYRAEQEVRANGNALWLTVLVAKRVGSRRLHTFVARIVIDASATGPSALLRRRYGS